MAFIQYLDKKTMSELQVQAGNIHSFSGWMNNDDDDDDRGSSESEDYQQHSHSRYIPFCVKQTSHTPLPEQLKSLTN